MIESGPKVVRVDFDLITDRIGKVRALLEEFPKPDEVSEILGGSTPESQDWWRELQKTGPVLERLVRAISKNLDATAEVVKQVAQQLAEADEEDAAELGQYATLLESTVEVDGAGGSSAGSPVSGDSDDHGDLS